jgi:hypothetical protein
LTTGPSVFTTLLEYAQTINPTVPKNRYSTEESIV